MNHSLSTLSFRSLLITVVLAAPVCAQNLTNFVNGTPANADQVNANFSALKTSVQAAQAKADAAATQATVTSLNTTVTTQGGMLTNLTNAISVTTPKVQIDRRLQFPRTSANRKVVLFEGADNEHEFYGFGVSEPTLRYQVDHPGSSHVFLAANNPTSSTELMRIQGNGRVGIGTNNPLARLHVRTGVDFSYTAARYFSVGFDLATAGSGTNSTGILCTNGSVLCDSFFIAYSDERIKNIVGRSDADEDLAILNGIEIRDYTFKDVVTRGNSKQKKVVAQQVESVYPQAVSRSTEVVPDIYQRAMQKDGWVTLTTDLKVGDRVRLIGEKEEGVHEVLEIGNGAFRTGFVPASENVFVYGREVTDFRSVDYDAISMLNVSATQELARRVETLTTENEALKNRVASLEAMAAEVAALKAALQPLLAK